MNFSVWAPRAKSVELVLGEERVAMSADDGGHWSAQVDAGRAAGGYQYSLDGGPPVPDPRSRWQPLGVHGASYIVDSAALRARQRAFTPKPLRDAVIYELHVGTFTSAGTYVAARGKLDHLSWLGVTHVELLPLATFPGAHGWGYDGVDLYAPLPAYGTPEELVDFIAACHGKGMAVLLDVVYNHLGPDGNYLGQFGPYFTDRVKTGWGDAINYDGAGSDEVRRYVVDNARMWLRDYGFDGLRLDAVHAIFSFEAVHLLEDLAAGVRALEAETGRSYVLIAESDLNDPRLVQDPARGGFGLDAHWADDFHHALHRFFTQESDGYYVDYHGLEDVAAALRSGYVYTGQYSPHRQRRHGREPAGVRPEQLVVSAQNHDQIGNRAQGERLSLLVDDDKLRAVATLLLLSPYVPMLFQGEEWGASTPFLYFTDHQDHELGRLVAEGRAREFGAFKWAADVPNPQDPATFERSILNWEEMSVAPHAGLLEWHRALLRLRKERKAPPPDENISVSFDAAQCWLWFSYGGLLAVFNFAENPQQIGLPPGEWQCVLASDATSGESDAWPAGATRVFKQTTSSGA